MRDRGDDAVPSHEPGRWPYVGSWPWFLALRPRLGWHGSWARKAAPNPPKSLEVRRMSSARSAWWISRVFWLPDSVSPCASRLRGRLNCRFLAESRSASCRLTSGVRARDPVRPMPGRRRQCRVCPDPPRCGGAVTRARSSRCPPRRPLRVERGWGGSRSADPPGA